MSAKNTRGTNAGTNRAQQCHDQGKPLNTKGLSPEQLDKALKRDKVLKGK